MRQTPNFRGFQQHLDFQIIKLSRSDLRQTRQIPRLSYSSQYLALQEGFFVCLFLVFVVDVLVCVFLFCFVFNYVKITLEMHLLSTLDELLSVRPEVSEASAPLRLAAQWNSSSGYSHCTPGFCRALIVRDSQYNF